METLNKIKNSTKEGLIHEISLIKAEYATLKDSFEKLQEKNLKVQKELTAREKELRAVFKLNSFMKIPDLSFDDFFKEVTNIIPSGYEDSTSISAKLQIGEKEYTTDNFKATEWKQSEMIFVNKKSVGQVEVFYLDQNTIEHKGSYLKRQQTLLKIIANNISKVIERKQAELELLEHQIQYNTFNTS